MHGVYLITFILRFNFAHIFCYYCSIKFNGVCIIVPSIIFYLNEFLPVITLTFAQRLQINPNCLRIIFNLATSLLQMSRDRYQTDKNYSCPS